MGTSGHTPPGVHGPDPTWLGPDRATVSFENPAAPRSGDAGDVYFSAEDGLAEARAVFLAGCGLPERWQNAGPRFVIGELGFGSGLNALAAWDAWRRTAPASSRLHMVSVEAAPLDAQTAHAMRATTPELAPGSGGDRALHTLSNALTARWPPAIRGVVRVPLDEAVTLTVAHLPVVEALATLEFQADAWFLDGFAPAKNPAMWTPEVMAQIAARSAPGARVATYTVAGAVRRGLTAAGFEVAKVPGFGRKRERLEGRLRAPPAAPSPHPCAWPLTRPRGGPVPPGAIVMIGAGVAGAAMADALRRRGRQTVIVSADPVGAGASGNPAALVMPRLDRDDRALARLHRAAFAFAMARYARIDGAVIKAGVVERAADGPARDRLTALMASGALPEGWLTPWPSASAMAGVRHVHAGVVRPDVIVHALLGDTQVVDGAAVRAAYDGGVWRVFDDADRELAAGVGLVVATGAQPGPNGAPTPPVIASRGQVTWARTTSPPDTAHTFGGYAAPLGVDQVLFGATYDPWPHDRPPDHDDQSDAANLTMLDASAPDIAASLDRATLKGRASLRATTQDRAPYAGPLTDPDAYRDRFDSLRHGRDAAPERGRAPLVPAAYMLGGLGSRGFTLAPLLAEMVASDMTGDPSAVEAGAAVAIHPARTLERAIKRS